MATTHYLVLGVDADASAEQIQSAYAHWAAQLQSQTPVEPPAELKELQRAYSVLAHPERRRAYDAQLAQSPSEAEPLRAPQPLREISLRDSEAEFNPSFEELFDRFWSNFSNVSRPKAERIEGLTVEVLLMPEEARAGGATRIMIPARAECPSCLGHGWIGLYECWQCSGHGAITADYPLEVSYPAGLVNEYSVQVPLSQFGIENFFLTVRFRVSGTD
jgi:DnaJ-class molecular chaperone